MKRSKLNIVYDKGNEELARYAKALGHPIRVEIMRHISKEKFCHTGDLVDFLPLAQSTISQHLKELKDAGLINGEVNPPKIKYCINRENLKKANLLFSDFFKTEIE